MVAFLPFARSVSYRYECNVQCAMYNVNELKSVESEVKQNEEEEKE